MRKRTAPRTRWWAAIVGAHHAPRRSAPDAAEDHDLRCGAREPHGAWAGTAGLGRSGRERESGEQAGEKDRE